MLCYPPADAGIVEAVVRRAVELDEARLEEQAVRIANAVGRLLK